jgi:arylsulfatase A-like enzyme
MNHWFREKVLKAAVVCCVLCPIAGAMAKEDGERPNVLFLFTDDQRNDTIAALGNKAIRTPHIDDLAKSGVAFKNAYIMGGSSPAVCSPSRACLFSGRTLWNIENQGIWGYEISSKYKTLPQVFRESGYVTFATGKNEPGRAGHFARSFSAGDKILFRGMTRSQYRLPLCPFSPTGDYSKQNEVLHQGKHSAEVYADACIKFLQDQADSQQPFFAYVSFQTPHDPRQSPEEYRAMYRDADMELPASFQPEHPFDNGMLKIRDEKLAKFPRTPDEIRRHIADYYAMITHVDAQVGRILEALDDAGKRSNTIIVFASDNGLAVGRHGLMGKQNVYEHSVRVPLIVTGPGIPSGETREQLCYIYDIYPTLCEKAGLETPATVEFKSLEKILDDAAAKHRAHLYFAFMSWQRAVRSERYKLIEYCVEGKRYTQLFDLIEDPQETNNLAGDAKLQDTLRDLRELLKKERVRLHDGNTPFEFANQQGQDFWSTYESTESTEIPR